MTIDEAKQISIKDYLESRGVRVEKNGGKWFCSSPFSRDSNWSFAIYPTNTFYCWSTGKSGDIIKLVQYMEGLDFHGAMKHLESSNFTRYQINYKKFKEDDDFWKDFDYTKYINNNQDEIKAIVSYGASRSITSGFHPGVYFTRDFDRGTWVRNPAMMFVHQDKEGNIIGAKFRNINGNTHPRFTTRGRLGFYILDTQVPKSYEGRGRVFLCESETSANSLWESLKADRVSATIISMGGVSSAPKELPIQFADSEIRLIIDYDGDERLYQERLKKYSHLNVTPIKIILPKGEDINSLFHRDEMWKIQNLLL